MKSTTTAAILSGLLAAVPAFADGPEPAVPQPAAGAQQVIVVRPDGGAPATTQRSWLSGPAGAMPGGLPAGLPGDARAIRIGDGPMSGNFTYQAVAVKLENAAWLGVGTTHPPKVLLKQLRIKAGLVVERVEPGSPAELAGVKTDDVLEKLDDQLLINPAQMEALVRMHAAGESISLTILHEGRESTVTAKLVEHEVVATPDDDMEPFIRLQRTGSGMPGAAMMGAGPADNPVPVFIRSGGPLPADPPLGAKSRFMLAQGFESSFSDGTNEMMVIHRDDKRVLVVNDASGKRLFEGPIDTAEQREKIPKELRASFQTMQKMADMADKQMAPGTTQP